MPAPDDLTLLIDAAHEAARIARQHWRTEQRVTMKHGDGGPVSDGDFAVDSYLRESLTAARPGYAWLSEETEDSPDRLSARTVFIVDPIDGTRSYIDGQKTWAHSLAVVHDGQPTAGVVYLPERGKLYSAALGQGASLNGAPIHVARNADPDTASVLAPKPSLDPKYWPGGAPPTDRHFRPSLAYRFCLVAEGRFDAMLTLRDAWEWDIAAGALIAAEAGATVTDRDGAPIRFNAPTPRAPGVICANPGLHGSLRKRMD